MFTIPELLAHPNIPKPLHGRSPRVILGQEWWDNQRIMAFNENGYHCWACGVFKNQAKYSHWLEGHEDYRYDWKKGVLTLNRIVGLCRSCHSFIHSGKLLMDVWGERIRKAQALDILEHGFGICKEKGVVPYFVALSTWKELTDKRPPVAKGWMPPTTHVPWNKWSMIIEGKRYYSLYASYEEWYEHYHGVALDDDRPEY